MTTLQKVQHFLALRLEIDERELTPERTLESLGIDSLAVLELIFELEDEFGIQVWHGDKRIKALGDLVFLIERELARPRAAAA